jgi:ribose transport system permease protein
MINRVLNVGLLGRVGILVLVWLLFTIGSPGFASLGNTFSILEGFALLGLVAGGIACTMIVGELDLSVGSVAAVAGMVTIITAPLGLPFNLLIATGAAAVFGLLQGWVIAVTGINSLVLTIGTLIGVRGIAFTISETAQLLPLDLIGQSDALIARVFVFSMFSIITIVVLIALGLFLGYTKYGREIYAVGGARDEARAAGVSVRRPIIIAFTISAACAGLGGGLASLRSASAAPIAYEPLLLAGVTACLIGGISLYGGRGTILGVVVGALIVRTLSSGLSYNGLPTYVESLAIGLLLLVVLILEFLTASPQARRWYQRRMLLRSRPIG